MPVTKLFLVDKRELFREGLAKLLESQPNLEVVGTGAGDLEAIEKADKLKPDIVLIDCELECKRAIELIKLFRKRKLDTKVILLTHLNQNGDIIGALEAGEKFDRIFEVDDNDNSDANVSKMLANGDEVECRPCVSKGRTKTFSKTFALVH